MALPVSITLKSHPAWMKEGQAWLAAKKIIEIPRRKTK
jgi:hypothetical protein